MRVNEGKLSPIQALTAQHTFAGPGTYNTGIRIPDTDSLDGSGFTWLGLTSKNASFSRPAIDDDVFERYTYCEGDFKVTAFPRYNTLANIRNGIADYQLGVPVPTFDPFVATYGGGVPSIQSATVFASGLAPGNGYAVGDTIQLAGGVYTQPAVVVVTQVDAAATGRIVSVAVQTPGAYSTVPAAPIAQASTSGIGTGAEFLGVWGNQSAISATVSAQGSGYNVGDIVQVVGGTETQAAQFTVLTVNPGGGEVGTVFVSTPGAYTVVPPGTGGTVATTTITGSGTGLRIFPQWSGESLVSASVYYSSLNGGSGFAIGDTMNLDGGTYTTQAVLTVSSIGVNGVITGVYVSTAGAYSVLPSSPAGIDSTSGSGTGAPTFNIVPTAGQVAVATPVAHGSGYAVGDTITIAGGTFTQAAVLRVATLTAGGTGVATVTIQTPGAYTLYPAASAGQASTSGGGSGATFNLVYQTVNPTETRAYVCTYVDIYGQESAPSNAAYATGETDGTWAVNQFALPNNNPGAQIVGINVYRTIANSTSSATYYYCGSVPFSGLQSVTIAPTYPGSNYEVGDVITLPGVGLGDTLPTITVTQVGTSGQIVSVEMTTMGYYLNALPVNVLAQQSTTGNGTGALFNCVFVKGGANYQFVDQTVDSTLALEAVQLLTSGWLPPPKLEGFIPVANGFLCGWAGNQIYFSQPGAPWAWPVAYQTAVDQQIVGMGYLDGSIVVLTTGSPFQLNGTSPASMTAVKISTVSPCTARGSIAQAIDGIDYAAPNGLMNASPYGFVNISDKVISAEEWRTEVFSQIIAGVRYEDTYMALTATGAGYILALQGYEGGYFMNPQNPRIALSRFNVPQPVTNMFMDPFSSNIFMMGANTVYLWDDPTAGTLVGRWKSREFDSMDPVNFAAFLVSLDIPSLGPQNTDELSGNSQSDYIGYAQVPLNLLSGLAKATSVVGYNLLGGSVIGAGVLPGTTPPGMTGEPYAPPYPYWPDLVQAVANDGQGGAGPGGSGDPDWLVVPSLPNGTGAYIEVYANRVTVFAGAVKSNSMQRLPSGFKASLWQFSITSASPVWKVALATSGKELRNAQ